MAIFGKAQPMQEMSDAERLAQIMQGNLAGQLNSGDKLSALGALLKSVSRGSTTTPQQVIQGLQQQKMQELQGRIQVEELKKQAERKAQLDVVRQQYISELQQTNPQLARAIQLMPADDFAKLIIEQNKAKDPVRLAFDQAGVPKDPFTGATKNPEAIIRNLPTIYGDEDPNYAKLPSGADYVGIDGLIRRKS